MLFVVVGGEEIHYGWDKLHTGSPSFKQWVLSRGEYDLSRFIFTGSGPARATGRDPPPERPAHLPDGAVRALVVALERDGHRLRGAGLRRPAGARGHRAGENGLVEPLFDVDRLTDAALRVLDDPAAFAPLGDAARRTIEERYSLEVCIPPLKDFFERVTRRRSSLVTS